MRNLIVTADDCGLSEGINLATASLCEKGIVTAVSVMTNFEASHHALELFARYPKLDMGIHLNLTDGVPLSKTLDLRGLIDGSGKFRGRWALFSNALAAQRGLLSAVKAELAAQIAFFLDAGFKPRHLTTHLHFHAFRSLQSIVFELAQEYKIEWVRNKVLVRAVVPHNIFLPQTRDAMQLENPGIIPSPDYLLVFQFWIRHENPKRLAAKLLNLEGTTELVIHPCLEQDPTYPKDVVYRPRYRFREMQYFEQFLQFLSTEYPNDFRLTTMRDLG